MQLTSNECFMTQILNCGYGDLDMLDNVYSKLAEECCDIETVIEDLIVCTNLSLNSLLSDVYYYITREITEQAKNTINRDDMFQEFIEENKLNKDDIDVIELTLKLNQIQNTYPFANCLDTHFNSDLDNTVDFNKSITENVNLLLMHLIKEQ